MSEGEDKNISLVNLGSLTKPVDTATKGIVDGAAAFLSKICLPASEEIGLLFKDKVSYWRAMNLAKILKKVKSKLKTDYREISPKHILSIIEGASLEENEELQDLWANLLSSGLDPNFKDTIRSAYIDIIKQLEVTDVHILNAIYQKYKQSVGIQESPDAGNQESPETRHFPPSEYPIYSCDILETFKLESSVYESSIDNLLRVRCIVSYIEEKEISMDTEGDRLLGSRAFLNATASRSLFRRGHYKRHQVTFDHRYEAVSLTSLGVGFIEACTT